MLDNRYLTLSILEQTKSYTKTAQQLFITQPAVSQQIKSLETELDLKLVEYHHPQLKITHAGKQLAEFAAQSNYQQQKLLSQLQDSKSRKHIKFGATHSISVFYIPDLIQNLQKKFTHINCIVDNTSSLLEKIDNGTLDFAILEGNFDKQHYDSIVLQNEDFVAVTRFDNSIISTKNLELTSLLHEPLLLRENGSGTRSIFINWAKTFNIQVEDFSNIIEIGSSAGLLKVLQQTGISFMYQSLITEQLQNNIFKILDIDGLTINRPISLVYAKDSFFKDEYSALI
ncbi:LysR family transcriptional regulator [Pediococcus claussenii]|uniref:Transcriptional regulator, LysR family n=1 Tax=Pediococcus claussenii (strain ATCC BAA-344 / DSM 14800 / JCM 18046 / KCTC 3811 / LMG 21948 / P06) TaxID=701521 RepID=G8PAT8_PEDCP|nr:LysR family transcriptional regulator [Pediococcus claussenii]AEV95806.1 Transcriptional regulator, LysR family [Pediococcus claussenii ATCC BAA-344]ANZ69304.1 transcriptional regulator [Pediococcus claussenii]ANZ71124.1 transcriptional regulator [Pediococcus claussenii]KRN20413.1 hypothetical protein IV79_GL000468 [Pediococcus claussenii]